MGALRDDAASADPRRRRPTRVINAIADRIAACGGTWLGSRSAELVGKFADVANAPDERVGELEASLRGL